MAATIHPSPLPTPPSSNPSTPSAYPAFPRLSSVQRTASSSSSRSNATTSSTSSSLVAVPMRPPPPQTRTATTTPLRTSRAGTPASNGVVKGAPTGLPNGVTDAASNGTLDSIDGGLQSLANRGADSISSPQASYAGRRSNRNGPRARGGTLSPPPSIVTAFPSSPGPAGPPTPSEPRSMPFSISPTTLRATQLPVIPMTQKATPAPLRVAVSLSSIEGDLVKPLAMRGSEGQRSQPVSPITEKAAGRWTPNREGEGRNDRSGGRGRRQSQVSVTSGSSSGAAGVGVGAGQKPSIRDYVLGEELGRGSYSTVFQATAATSSSTSPTSPRPPRQYAIKIINQAHLYAEKKVKYATIERDALIRLATPKPGSPTSLTGPRRGPPGVPAAGGPTVTNRKSNTSVASASATDALNGRDGPNLNIRAASEMDSHSKLSGSTTSVSALAGRRPSRAAEPPEMVPERSEDGHAEVITEETARSPSLVKGESGSEMTPPRRSTERMDGGSPDTSSTATLSPDLNTSHRAQTPRRRRQSLATSESSFKSTRSSTRSPVAHPGIIRLYLTFVDSISLYFVLDLAANGELLTFIRKHGSFDLTSTRYYAAQLIDTVEFMHERGVIHRDLKPENILLDDEMRIKITDFGSARLLNHKLKESDGADEESRKRSFVGSADFVSPEVLRNDPAVMASDIWAFGCILYQLLIGKPPFRGATDYLTFQKILKNELEYPDGFDEEAKALLERILHLDPAQRPLPAVIKADPFFASIDFSNLWHAPAPLISTGLARPVATLATVDPSSDLWAVFDDEVSDGGFEYDQDEPRAPSTEARSSSPRFDRYAAANAVQSVDAKIAAQPRVNGTKGVRPGSNGSLEPPRPSFMAAPESRKTRGWSSRSARSSTSSANRSALTGLLETIKLSSAPRSGSSRTSRTSERSDELRVMNGQSLGKGEVEPAQGDDLAKWSSLLLANERIIHSSPISVRPSTSSKLPTFLQPSAKRYRLILTDFPRLISVKDEAPSAAPDRENKLVAAQLKIKTECVFVVRPSGGPAASPENRDHSTSEVAGPQNRVVDVNERGAKGFVVQTVTQSHHYMADSGEGRDRWLAAIKQVTG